MPWFILLFGLVLACGISNSLQRDRCLTDTTNSERTPELPSSPIEKTEPPKPKIFTGMVIRRHDTVLGGYEEGGSTMVNLVIKITKGEDLDKLIEVRGPATQYRGLLDRGCPKYVFLVNTQVGDEVEFSYQPAQSCGNHTGTYDELYAFRNLTLAPKEKQ